jgi:hypothetical protein
MRTERIDDIRGATDIVRGFLDCDEMLIRRKFSQYLVGHIHPVRDAVGIDHDRQITRNGNCFQRRYGFFRIRMIDGAWNQHQAVRTGFGSAFCQRGSIACCRFIDGQEHGLALGNALRSPQDLKFLIVAKHRPFAERPCHDQPVATCIHQQRKAAFHFPMIKTIILREFAGNCWEYS